MAAQDPVVRPGPDEPPRRPYRRGCMGWALDGVFWWNLIVAGWVLVLLAGGLLAEPGAHWVAGAAALVVVFAVGIALGWRFRGIGLWVDAHGIVVRRLLRTERISWSEVDRVEDVRLRDAPLPGPLGWLERHVAGPRQRCVVVRLADGRSVVPDLGDGRLRWWVTPAAQIAANVEAARPRP